MTRLAHGRDTHLVPEEIAREALRQFDSGIDPSIRSLASALKVAPSAIYHHYPSRDAIVQAATDLVWMEIPLETFRAVGDPFEADPVEVLVESGLATRRAFSRHYRIAPYMTATPQPDAIRTGTLALMANVLERLGLEGDEAAQAFHTYASYIIGIALFVASRHSANEELRHHEAFAEQRERFRSQHDPTAAGRSSEATRVALDGVMDISTVDPEHDEQLYVVGLRKLIGSLTT